MINNTLLNDIHKDAIAFFLGKLKNIDSISQKLNVSLNDLLQQINSSTIVVENTPYYCIIKFYHNGVYESFHDTVIEIQVIRKNAAPTVLHMYLLNNTIYEFEYFIGDSSKMSNQELFIGDVAIKIY